jgi:hypothetical protein
MADILKSGMTWLNQQRQAHMSSLVVYRREGIAPVALGATHSRTDIEIADDYGATISAFVEDFLVPSDVPTFEPEAGDVIVADGRKYEVMNLGGEGCWRWSDPHRQARRIHTKDIGANA